MHKPTLLETNVPKYMSYRNVTRNTKSWLNLNTCQVTRVNQNIKPQMLVQPSKGSSLERKKSF